MLMNEKPHGHLLVATKFWQCVSQITNSKFIAYYDTLEKC